MEIKFKERYCVASTTISDINNKEMRQMHEMKERIAQVLNSHKDEKLKNEYLSDDELRVIHAILYVFTKDFAPTQESAFDNALKELNKSEEKKEAAEQPQQQDEDI